MKTYGAKQNNRGKKGKDPPGDGCFLCTKERKTTKSAVRTKAKKEINETLRKIVKI